MKIGYLILAHHKPRQLEWLFEAIHNPEDVFAIHVDRKSPDDVHRCIRALVGGRPNVHVLPSRPVVWASWSAAATQLEGMIELRELDPEWRCFVSLSGQDYPLKTPDAIRAELAEAPDRNHVEVGRIDAHPRPERIHLVRRRRYRRFEIGGHIVGTPIPRIRPRGIRIDWKGSSWNTLSRAFCDWIATDRVAARCIRAVRGTYVPDEFLMQTLAMNGPFAETVTGDDLREILWTGDIHPTTLTMRHRERLFASPAHFARKFDEDVDAEILHALARRIGARPPR